MVDIRKYIFLSKTAKLIVENFTMSQTFKEYYWAIEENEKRSLLSHYIINNIPFAFRKSPILYEQITQYLADKLKINASQIRLIGSAKTGFSISPPPTYGKDFGQHSDLDFSIINPQLYFSLQDEFSEWSLLFREQKLKPLNQTEEKYWYQNVDTGKRQFALGFIDTHYIPNREQFTLTKRINNSMFLIQKNIDEIHGIRVKKATASIYRSWEAFIGRLQRNTEFVMTKIK